MARELPRAKLDQINIIKKRLNDEYERYVDRGGNINHLRTTLNNNYSFELNYDTLRKTLSLQDHTLDFFCVLALCRYWKMDTAYIFSPPDNEVKPMPAVESQLASGKYVVLNDKDYLGTYYGFLLSNKPGQNDLHRMRLKIEDTPGGFAATLTVESEVRRPDGKKPLKKQLHGTPILSTFNNNIAILMTDDIGNLFFLYTEYKPYLGQGVYYRKGVAVTSGATSEREPVMQAFVLFERPIPEEKLAYIPGLLLPPQTAFSVTQDSMEQLKANQPLLEQFFEEFDYLLEHNQEMTYLINETVILAEKSSMSREDRIKAILLLKEKALAANRFFFTPDADYPTFSKRYLQSPAEK